MSRKKAVLVTGATGFVGRHLHGRLAAHGFHAIGGTRRPNQARAAEPEREYRYLDVGDESATRSALAGCQAAVYLVHSMADSPDYHAVEERSARLFARAAAAAGIERIVYLGAVRPQGEGSRHLQSRVHTGEVLREGPVPVLELQASMIIGAGSESFRMVRDLAARLPVMLLPRWLETRSEPVALDDVLYALERALELPLAHSVAYPLPGPEVLSGREILTRTAHLLGMDPRMLGVPFLTPRLSSYWITLITRADRHVSRQLVEGLLSDLTVREAGFWRLCPEHRRLEFDEAVRRALADEERDLSGLSRAVEQVIRRLSPSTEDTHEGEQRGPR